MIELKNINKQFYQKDRIITALSNVSLHVPKGKIFGVIGSSGAGKSTLIRCVNLLEKPDSGKVVIDGRNLLHLSPAQLIKTRRNMGMIFQHFHLLSSRTVFENIAFPLELGRMSKSKIKERVADLLSLVGISDKLHAYPANLSGGQKQRVAIARALANNPKIILCDEATSALDPATTKSILNLLKDINKRLNITILLITHEMEVIKNICEEVAVMNQGKLIEQGTVEAIFSRPKTELANQFINSSFHIDVPTHYLTRLSSNFNEKNKHPLLKLKFTDRSVDTPIISRVAKLFQVDNNIISAQIDYVGGVQFGMILIEVMGAEENCQKAISFYRKNNINVELIGYV